MRIADIKYNDIVDGDGVCLSVWFQGCPHKCKGCHNPETWDFNGGYEIEYQDGVGNLIIYAQSGEIELMGVGFDNEDAEFHEIVVNGYKGYSYSKLGSNALYWTDGISLFRLIGTCDMETLWQMVESIK